MICEDHVFSFRFSLQDQHSPKPGQGSYSRLHAPLVVGDAHKQSVLHTKNVYQRHKLADFCITCCILVFCTHSQSIGVCFLLITSHTHGVYMSKAASKKAAVNIIKIHHECRVYVRRNACILFLYARGHDLWCACDVCLTASCAFVSIHIICSCPC